MCSPEANFGKKPRDVYVIGLDSAKKNGEGVTRKRNPVQQIPIFDTSALINLCRSDDSLDAITETHLNQVRVSHVSDGLSSASYLPPLYARLDSPQ